jgi:hypothetical protein
METNNERRRRKLIELCKRHGGYVAVAEKAGVTAATLDQVIKGVLLPPKQDGSRSPRALGNTNARAIEDAFGLGHGWFDAVEPTSSTASRQLSAAEWEDFVAAQAVLTPAEWQAIRERARHAEDVLIKKRGAA